MAEQGPQYYNDAYRREKLLNGQPNHYRESWSKSPMLPTWQKVISWIKAGNQSLVLDLGCGPGQFAEALRASGYTGRYWGADFSRTAVTMARAKNIENTQFHKADIRERSFLLTPSHDLILAVEVLEHIEADLATLGHYTGCRIIASVPDHDDKGHVRHFPTRKTVEERYSEAVKLDGLEKLGKHWIFKGFIQ